MLDITLVAVGKIKDKNYAALASEYLKRLKPYARLKIIETEALSFTEQTKTKAKDFEGEKLENILDKQKDTGLVYLLAERGQLFDSPSLANWFQKKGKLTLVLGGTLGFSDKLYQKYPSLSLSALTFPHELARVILFEQLYRAATILQNKNYHY